MLCGSFVKEFVIIRYLSQISKIYSDVAVSTSGNCMDAYFCLLASQNSIALSCTSNLLYGLETDKNVIYIQNYS